MNTSGLLGHGAAWIQDPSPEKNSGAGSGPDVSHISENVHNYPNMHSLARYRSASLVSFFVVLAPLEGQLHDRDLPAARVGAVYVHALDTNRPAYFEKSAGNSAWLTVTRDGVLTGTPPPDAPPRAEITVTAHALAAAGQNGAAALVRSFVVPVEQNSCTGEGLALAWCDALPALPNPRPAQSLPPVFSPKNFELIIKSENGESIQTANCGGSSGCILQFHRLLGVEGKFGSFDATQNKISWTGYSHLADLEVPLINAVNASKVFISGSVFINEHVHDCGNLAWSVVTQTVESSNNLVYEPSDLTYFCARMDQKEQTVLIVLPVHAMWASVYPRPANRNDPAWRPASTPPPSNPCDSPVPPRSWESIRPCDVGAHTPFRRASGWVYNRLALPGVSQGSISVSPIMPGTKSTWDVQLYSSTLLGPGWAGLQLMYEHDRKSSDDLNSLTAALTYDVRIPRKLGFLAQWGSQKTDAARGDCGRNSDGDCTPPYVGLRPPELNLRFGPEYSPDAFSYTPKIKDAVKQYLPRDLNLVGATTLRLPIIISAPIRNRQEPSQISIAPVGGVEAGVRMISHGILTAMPCPSPEPPQCAQPQTIFRRVGGFDASSRWPYNITKNFLGDKPVTIDYSYRIRWLTDEEPFSNQELVIRDNNIAANTPDKALFPASGQSPGARIYQRITLIAPFSAYVQFRASWQHGSLPPVFQFVSNEVTIGLAFSNPGSSEH